jgi:hypothetical protein
MAITLNVSALTAYTDQLTLPIIRNTVLASTLMDAGINYQEGVDNTSVLNILTNNLVVQASGNCAAFSASGSNALSQNTISTLPLTIMMEDCPDTFKTFWTKIITKAGSYNEADPEEYSRIYTAYLLDQVSALVEDYFFCGASNGAYSSTLTATNGILYNLEYTSASASVITAGSTYSGGITSTNAINLFYAMRAALPLNIVASKDLTWFVSHAGFFNLTQALTQFNYFHDFGKNGSADGNYVIYNLLGTNITVRAMRGLQYTTKSILTEASNLYLGCDLQNDWEKVRVWFSMDFQTVRTQIKWRQGATVAFPQNVVKYNG